MNPSVSINLCCYNSEKYLRETLDSIVRQTYKDWELIIINDGSTDSTESIILEYRKRNYPIIYQYQENRGLGASRNEALKLSRGDYIAFIDHDDIWLPQKLEKQMALFKRSPRVGLVYCNTIFFNQLTGRERVLYKKRNQPTGMVFRELLSRYFLSIETVVINRNCLDGLTEWFDERLSLIEEADLFIRIGHNWQLDYIHESLAKWRIHNESLTWSKMGHISKEWRIVLNKYTYMYESFNTKYKKEIRKIEARAAYREALENWKNNGRSTVRRIIMPHIASDPRLFAVYLLSALDYEKYSKLMRLFGRHA